LKYNHKIDLNIYLYIKTINTMGIKELNPFLQQNTACVEEWDLCCLKDKKVAIDTSIYLYKYLYGNGNHLDKFIQQIYRFRLNKITPIYIFDGKPTHEKKMEIENRANKKKNNRLIIDDLKQKCKVEVNSDEKVKLEKELKIKQAKVINVTRQHIIDLKYMLDLLNVKFIQADCEADIICSQLYINGKVDMVLSDDMDLLASGTGVLLRGFSVNSNKINVYNLEKILKQLELTYSQWVDFCILCGCDYVKRIKKMGIKTSFKLVKRYNTIENIISNIADKFQIYDNYLENCINARKLFTNVGGYKDEYNNLEITMDDLYDNQLDNIKEYFVKNTRFDISKIDEKLTVMYN
jgi:flap endonuclease-1